MATNGVPVNGEALRRARLRKGWSLREMEAASIALGLPIDHTKICRYESGDLKPYPRTLKKLADVLEVTVDCLLEVAA